MPYNPIIDLDQLRGKTIESASLEEFNEVLVLKFTDGTAFAIAAVVDSDEFFTNSSLPYLKIKNAIQSLHTLLNLGLIDQAEFDAGTKENRMRFELKPNGNFPVHWKEPNNYEIREFIADHRNEGYSEEFARKWLRKRNYRSRIPDGYKNWADYWDHYFNPINYGR